MTRREQLCEQYEDALFALMIDGLIVRKGTAWLEENERIKNDPSFDIPEHAANRCLNTIRKYFSAQSAHNARKTTARILQRVAAVGFIAALLFTAALAVSTKFRVNVLNFTMDVFGDRAVFYSNTTEGLLPDVTAGWLPEGYKLADYASDSKDVKAVYQTPDGKEILIHIYGSNRTNVVDTENAEVGSVYINGDSAATIYKQGNDGYGNPYEYSSVIWLDFEGGCFIDISSYHESVQELVQVAEGLVLS